VTTGVGCSAASDICVPLAATANDQCALADGASTCAGYQQADTAWYDDYDDQRSCGACFCTAVGGDCANMIVQIGSDYSCINAAQVGDHMQNCIGGFGIYSPPAQLVGTPTPPTGCDARAPISGEITPTGQQTLCCAPG
jgi:hypothetical protein